MSKPIKIQYNDYIQEKCCEHCDYAGKYKKMPAGLPPMPVSICPECGGKLITMVGRWMYTVIPLGLWDTFNTGSRTKTVYHGFARGRECEAASNPLPAPTEYVKQ